MPICSGYLEVCQYDIEQPTRSNSLWKCLGLPNWWNLILVDRTSYTSIWPNQWAKGSKLETKLSNQWSHPYCKHYWSTTRYALLKSVEFLFSTFFSRGYISSHSYSIHILYIVNVRRIWVTSLTSEWKHPQHSRIDILCIHILCRCIYIVYSMYI